MLLWLTLLLTTVSAFHRSDFIVHYSDTLKIKCESLLYRSVYTDNTCYFVLNELDEVGNHNEMCNRLLKGAKVSGGTPDAIFSALLVDKERFHDGLSSTGGNKKAICYIENNFRCAAGSSELIPGKCYTQGTGKMTYKEATAFCARTGAVLPSPQNRIENQDLVGGRNSESLWLQPVWSGSRWSGLSAWSRYSTCTAMSIADASFCKSAQAATLNPTKSTTSFWGLSPQSDKLNVMCVKDAISEFYSAPSSSDGNNPDPKKPRVWTPADCIAAHRWNAKRGICDWTLKKQSCMQLTNVKNEKMQIMIEEYPDKHFKHISLIPNFTLSYNDATIRAIVRYGCMATLWTHPIDPVENSEVRLLSNIEYGDYEVPVGKYGTSETDWAGHGLTRISCYCDPYLTEEKKPAKKDCVDSHQWDEEQQKCVWTGEDNVCAVVTNSDSETMKLVMPNWPLGKRYDVNLKDANITNFTNKITDLLVRQGCIATVYSTKDIFLKEKILRGPASYGKYSVEAGAIRVLCQCMNNDFREQLKVVTPQAPNCLENHVYNETTKACEWIGDANGCVLVRNAAGATMTVAIPNYPTNAAFELDLTKDKKEWNEKIWQATVRRGCMATFWAGTQEKTLWTEIKLLQNAEYGTYELPTKQKGTVQDGVEMLGVTRVQCMCDKTQTENKPAPETEKCLEGHTYSKETGQCEWTGSPNHCATIITYDDKKKDLKIPNYPTNKRFDTNIAIANWIDYNDKIVAVRVRQHCFVTLYKNFYYFMGINLNTSGYGYYDGIQSYWAKTLTKENANDGVSRIVCECMYTKEEQPVDTDPKPLLKLPKLWTEADCVAGHKWNAAERRCDWTLDKQACVQLFNTKGEKLLIKINQYPNKPYNHTNLIPQYLSNFNDATSRAIVRYGCMATLWTHPVDPVENSEVRLYSNIEFGDYQVPVGSEGTSETDWAGHGLTRVSCYCDPNFTEDQKQEKTVCVDKHVWDEEQKKCLWTGDADVCGVVTNDQNEAMTLKMPNWPLGKRFDVNLKEAGISKFEGKISSLLVRQGCFATVFSSKDIFFNKTKILLAPTGYGKFDVKTGALRVVCECMNEDSREELRVITPAAPDCLENHKYNEATGTCDWIGEANGCVLVRNVAGENMTVAIPNYPKNAAFELDLTKTKKEWNEKIWQATVRRGCMATFWAGTQEKTLWTEIKLLQNAEYGTYELPQKQKGTVQDGVEMLGVTRVQCMCDRTQTENKRAPESEKCLKGHTYSQQTGQCEWDGKPNYCSTIITFDGKEKDLVIPNYPTNKRFDTNIAIANWIDFNDKIVAVRVRQHCFLTLYMNFYYWMGINLNTTGYGYYDGIKSYWAKTLTKETANDGVSRIVCECMYPLE